MQRWANVKTNGIRMRDYVRLGSVLGLLLLIPSAHAIPETRVPGGNVEGRWSRFGSPYWIDGDIRIQHGRRLVIDSGVRVVFAGLYGLDVRGVLEAKGREGDSVYFVPRDTAVGWRGVRFLESEHGSMLEYCVLTYGRGPFGGAIVMYGSDPGIVHCLIANCTAWAGGGIALERGSHSQLRYCHVLNNNATGDNGGGIYVSLSAPVISNCLIQGNRTVNMGGGIITTIYGSPLIDSCVIAHNYALRRGGGIAFYTNAKPTLRNSIIADNDSPLGGGIYIDEFYNEFREQVGKIDIQIVRVRIEHNRADYGGGMWFRDTMGEVKDATICNNRAIIGGGVYIEHNPPHFPFSSKHLCSVYMNFARIMGNDFFRLGGDNAYVIPLDTFTVQHYSALNAEPIEKFTLQIRNYKLPQVNADLYVSPDGDDAQSGLTAADPLRSLKMAFLKILADSTSPRTIYLHEGEYVFTETNDVLMLGRHRNVRLKGIGFTDVVLGTDRISVVTPWWMTVWALGVYGATLVTVIATVWNVRMKRLRMKHDLEKERFEAQKLHELDELKTRFFTNISHEFRTPLTLILGPAKQLMARMTDEKSRDDVDVIHRSARKLARLVDELLDISRIEAGEMKLKACPENLVAVVEEAALPFHAIAERRRATFTVKTQEREIVAYVDREKCDKILGNILSNAFKFTPEGGSVEVEIVRRPYVAQKSRDARIPDPAAGPSGAAEVTIRDTGIGIPRREIDKIFDRFYQVDGSHTREHEGTGIGLALTKELVELHRGRIEVESEEGKGSTFRVILPLGKDHLNPEEICAEEIRPHREEEEAIPARGEDVKRQPEHALEGAISGQAVAPSVLIVEDNADVRRYLRMVLEKGYETMEAHDGEDGLRKALEQIPDLIILDVMMPKLDGFQVCEMLKNDPRTSHIPVVMLTAKATVRDKISGFEVGADEYIMKPFEPAELKARIRNLLDQRKRLHEHFRKHGLVDLEEKSIVPADRRFLRKAAQVMQEHLSDAAFGVEAYAESMGISRSLLLKKMEALLGESPSELIKRTRLKRAATLLATHAGNISEIALEVGFSNPAYFSECFRREFGCLPSHYHRGAQKPVDD